MSVASSCKTIPVLGRCLIAAPLVHLMVIALTPNQPKLSNIFFKQCISAVRQCLLKHLMA